MTHYDFWFAPSYGETFRCTIAQDRDNYRACLESAALLWELLLPFGDPLTRHPITGEFPDEFRARSNT